MHTLSSIRLMLLAVTVSLTACKKDEPHAAKPVEVAQPLVAAKASVKTIALEVTDEGFVPDKVSLKAGEPVALVVTRKTDETCAKAILIEGTDIKKDLPLGESVTIAWTPTKAGKVKFGCAMDMMIGGVLLVE